MNKICQNKTPGLIDQITMGVNMALNQCQYQFRHRRWNCTNAGKSIKKVMSKDTRETAFVNAIVAAGITYQVTRACTKGEQIGCMCNKRKKKNKKKKHPDVAENDFKWDGCAENIDFGIKRSKDFLEGRQKKRRSDMSTLVKFQNYKAGRLAIKNHMRKECKCHGPSGSCVTRTCIRKLPQFREVGDRLKERFDGATKVISGNDGQSIIPSGDAKPPGPTDLVYSEESPNFCQPNSSVGSFGTQGRECNETSPGEEGCDILCCGRGFHAYTKEVAHSCDCKFVYCCNVTCQVCNETVRVATCQ
ncbi:hypothetical protein GWI33_012451 [Rhynchophorus ferrugineus]|uniref:Protein Wnt n=1 Tax=Rhynchophorus ferrugineus TaxID=354439 RepID=A0A834IBK3_RHYFE|nr:hypothetical protein GWI33_012451 [Rhynchophorus ferrugineus]